MKLFLYRKSKRHREDYDKQARKARRYDSNLQSETMNVHGVLIYTLCSFTHNICCVILYTLHIVCNFTHCVDDLRCLSWGNFLSQINTLLSLKVLDLKMCECKKIDKYQVWGVGASDLGNKLSWENATFLKLRPNMTVEPIKRKRKRSSGFMIYVSSTSNFLPSSSMLSSWWWWSAPGKVHSGQKVCGESFNCPHH